MSVLPINCNLQNRIFIYTSTQNKNSRCRASAVFVSSHSQICFKKQILSLCESIIAQRIVVVKLFTTISLIKMPYFSIFKVCKMREQKYCVIDFLFFLFFRFLTVLHTLPINQRINIVCKKCYKANYHWQERNIRSACNNPQCN